MTISAAYRRLHALVDRVVMAFAGQSDVNGAIADLGLWVVNAPPSKFRPERRGKGKR